MKATKLNSISLGIILSGLFFFSTSLSAQETFELRGNVINLTKERVQNATVILSDPTTKQTIDNVNCNQRGEFVFNNIVPGEYIITASKEGYTKNESCVISLDSNGKCTKKSSLLNSTRDETKDNQIASKQ